MTDALTPTQALALWALLARQGRAPAAEVKPKADRDALLAAGLVLAEKPSKTVALTDAGWNWAATHFDVTLPPAQRPLQDLLTRIGHHLAASGTTLADMIGEAPPLPVPPAKPKAAPKPRAAAKPKAPPHREATSERAPPRAKPPTAAALRQRIEAAYLRITGGARSEPVRLSRLRTELEPLDRKTVDAALARIVKARTETARLSQISDNKAIDTAEREAAFSPAGEPFHLIRIQ